MRAMQALAVALSVRCAIALAQAAVTVPAYRVIVNAQNPSSSVQRSFVADAFLKKTTRWSSGVVVLPVDLGANSSVRRKFCEELLGRSVSAVRSYWQQMIFAGRDIPPPELDSDDEVVKYVAKHPGAIGYVSGGANVASDKVVSCK